MSMAVLYDVPGPRTKARHRLFSVLGTVGITALLGLLIWKLWAEDQITPDRWGFLSQPSIVEALLEGLLVTLTAAAVAIFLAAIFGGVFSAARLSDHAVIRWPAIAVIEFFRAVPLLLLILFLFLAFGQLLGSFWALVLGLMLYNGSVLAEVFRAGVLAVPKGQSEAAYAIGLRKGQVMRLILAPQAVRTMLPAIISQCVVALKDTALGYVIGAAEFTRAGKQIFTSIQYNNPIAVGVVLMATFIAVNYSLSRLARLLEQRQRRQGRPALGEDASELTTGA